MVAKFILQVPQSTANIGALIETGMRPMQFRIYKRQLSHFQKMLNNNKDNIVSAAFKESMFGSWNSGYRANIFSIMGILGGISTKEIYTLNIKEFLHDKTITNMEQKWMECAKSLCALPPKEYDWFKLGTNVNDGLASKTLNEFKLGNSGLGNRAPTKLGDRAKLCPFCRNVGKMCIINETHVVVDCIMTKIPGGRIDKLTKKYERIKHSNVRILRNILGMDGADAAEMKERAIELALIRDKWVIDLNRAMT